MSMHHVDENSIQRSNGRQRAPLCQSACTAPAC